MTELINQLVKESSNFSLLELIAVLTALAYIALASIGNKWCFLFGFISSAIYVYLATVLKYYFDSFINFYYLVMSVYGWLVWSKKGKGKDLAINSMPIKNLIRWLLLALAISLLLGFVASYTDAALPYWDAITTVYAILATYLVVKKVLENWLIWIGVDFIAMIMYFEKELLLTAALFLIYTVIAFHGYFKWKKALNHA